MFVVGSYQLAVIFCVITMIAWGSWTNAQKLTAKSWRYEFFYWDYMLGILFFSLFVGLTLGSHGETGRPFLADLRQLSLTSVFSIFLGGCIGNAGNILVCAAISLAGMALACPVAVGTAAVLGVILNYCVNPVGNVFLLCVGVILLVAALVFNGISYARVKKGARSGRLGIFLALVSGILMGASSPFVARAMELESFTTPEVGKALPYSAFFIFACGLFFSNFLWGTIMMKKPVQGEIANYRDYFRGTFSNHIVGFFCGCFWSVGSLCNYLAFQKAGVPIAYALGQTSPLIAALWGVFVWKEFKGADKKTYVFLTLMFFLFLAGLSLIILAGKN